MRRKALLAIAFAGGLVGNQLPALAEPDARSTSVMIDEFANQREIPPEERAFWLLRMAVSYLGGGKKKDVEARYWQVARDLGRGRILRSSRRNERVYVNWAKHVSEGVIRGDDGSTHKIVLRTDTQGDECVALARAAIHKALMQLDQSTDVFAKLSLYFTASRLLLLTGDVDTIKQCDRKIEDFFQTCEGDASANEENISAAVSVLNSMAYGKVPIEIPDSDLEDRFRNRKGKIEPVSEKDFEESERLKLRSAAMVDKLPSASHLRRKTHRDLALWYMKLGKTEQGNKEKQILYGLVGCDDDRLLYPHNAGCGHLIWWNVAPPKFEILCGMG